ncbi:M24 family metallopeptidase [Rhodopila sp.]|uniref:M24 family metallopeptidase n=1 Tax=Rhodopila sp. TaxID=2480087 RepID=UPI003D0AE10B
MQNPPSAPFDTLLLDRLMEAAGVDLLLATSKPNVQYLLGGHRSGFFEHADAIGLSRYLPIVIYPRGRADQTAYIGHKMETFQQEVSPLWVSAVRTASSGSGDAMRQAVEFIKTAGLPARRIAAELGFLPADAFQVLRDGFPGSQTLDALPALERLRARKRPHEIDKLRLASDRVIDAMLAVIAGHGPGTTKHQLVEALRREQVMRGLDFDYCLITAGSSLNRAASDQPWQAGEILSLDSGGNFQGYIGDVCRMGILGEPDTELVDLLGEVDAIQQAAFQAVRGGVPGQTIYDLAEAVRRRSPHAGDIAFLAHGMGLVSHEVPHLTATGPVPYPAEDADRPLDSGMVLSIETTLRHPRRGFIKLEDTVLVREQGHEILGAAGRGWNRGNTRSAAAARSIAA